MEYSTLAGVSEVSETGISYALGSLYDRFHDLTDPRKAKGKRYHLVTLLVLIFLAKLSQQDTPMAIADWAKNHAEELVRLLGLERDWMPHHNTYRRVFQSILSQAEFEQLMQDYHQQMGAEMSQALQLDGKVLRGTGQPDGEAADQVLSLYDGAHQRVLVQEVVDRKENEIPAAARVCEQVTLKGKVVTGDALHTQRVTSAAIVQQGGDYVWPVKENQLHLLEDIQRLFAPEQPKPGFGLPVTDFQVFEKVNAGHGRIEKRTLTTSTLLNDYLDWPGVHQVYRLERKFTWLRHGVIYKTSEETEYGITSLSREKATVEQLYWIRRGHWQIETGLHYRRDVTFHEDATRMTQGSAGVNLAIVHNLALGLLKRAGFQNAAAGRRWLSAHLPEAFALLTTAYGLS
jgi:predicted transposase YbfD/YdcC